MDMPRKTHLQHFLSNGKDFQKVILLKNESNIVTIEIFVLILFPLTLQFINYLYFLSHISLLQKI